MILTWLATMFDWVQVIASYFVVRLKSTVLKLLAICSIFMVMLWLSMFLYGSFHYVYMPSNSHVKPLHFNYDVDCETNVKLCSFPSSNISLVPPDQDHILMPGPAYTIAVYLEMPESPVNQQLGMFLVQLDFFNKTGDTISSQKRTAMLRFKSVLLQIIETFANAPFFLSGMSEQKQEVIVQLYEHFEDNAYNPITSAYVAVLSKNIEIYSAKLKIDAKYTGLRYLIFSHPIISAFFGIGCNLIFLIAIAILYWYRTNDSMPIEDSYNPVLTLEERRKALRATMHSEKANSGQGKPGEIVVDNNGEPALKKMSTRSKKALNKMMAVDPITSERQPETISSLKDDDIDDITILPEVAEGRDLDKFDYLDIELRQRKVDQNSLKT